MSHIRNSSLALTFLLLGVTTAWPLAIDPLRTELKVAPGTTLTGAIAIANEKGVPINLAVSFRDMTAGSAQGSSWIRIDTSSRSLQPGETNFVSYTLTVPGDASGEFIGRVGFQEVTEGQADLAVRTRISVPIYVIVSGTETYEGEIEKIRLVSTDPLQAEVTVHNSGNVHLRAQGECIVTDASDNSIVSRFRINDQGFPLYPGRLNRIVGNGRESLSEGTYRVIVNLPFPDEEHMLSKVITVTVPEEDVHEHD